jgi:hypothetical protein
MKLTTTLTAALIAMLITAASAANASTPFQFALGKEPDLAVDAQGTAHVVWTDTQTPVTNRVVRYCRIPRGQRACQNEQGLLSGNEFGRPHVFVSPSGEIVVAAGLACSGGPCGAFSDRIVVRRSTDGGLSFGGADVRSMTVLNQFGEADDAAYGPGDSISTVTSQTSGVYFLNAPLSGPLQQSTARLHTASSDGPAVGLNGSQPVVVFHDQGSGALMSRAYSGAGSLNAQGAWNPPVTIDPNGTDDTALAGGPSGLFLIHSRSPFRGPVVRKFTGNGWTNGVVIGRGSVNFPDITQDASGRLHALWVANDNPDRLEWRTSKDGVKWGPIVTIDIAGEHLPELHLAAAPDGKGFAAWDARGGPNGGVSRLMGIPLEPFTGPGSPYKMKGESCKWPNCLPASGGKPSKKLGGKQVTLGVSVPSCAKKSVKVKLKKLKKKMGSVVVQKVVFKLGKAKKTDKKPAYGATFPLKGATLGKRYTVKATVHYTVGGKAKKLGLSKRFYVCPLA